ncbi:Os01g0564400, partial [Oryza sativa Japonica Group]
DIPNLETDPLTLAWKVTVLQFASSLPTTTSNGTHPSSLVCLHTVRSSSAQNHSTAGVEKTGVQR